MGDKNEGLIAAVEAAQGEAFELMDALDERDDRIRGLQAKVKQRKAETQSYCERLQKSQASLQSEIDWHHYTKRKLAAAEAKLAILVEGLKGLENKCLCASEHHSRLGLEGPDQYWQFARDLTELRALATRIFTQGYMHGHNDTVESCFTDIKPQDEDDYFADLVVDLSAYRELEALIERMDHI